jgi:hypothetical protein
MLCSSRAGGTRIDTAAAATAAGGVRRRVIADWERSIPVRNKGNILKSVNQGFVISIIAPSINKILVTAQFR